MWQLNNGEGRLMKLEVNSKIDWFGNFVYFSWKNILILSLNKFLNNFIAFLIKKNNFYDIYLCSIERYMTLRRECRQPPLHIFRTSFYLFAAVRVPIGLPNFHQTVFREWTSVYIRKFLFKTRLIRLFNNREENFFSTNVEIAGTFYE